MKHFTQQFCENASQSDAESPLRFLVVSYCFSIAASRSVSSLRLPRSPVDFCGSTLCKSVGLYELGMFPICRPPPQLSNDPHKLLREVNKHPLALIELSFFPIAWTDANLSFQLTQVHFNLKISNAELLKFHREFSAGSCPLTNWHPPIMMVNCLTSTQCTNQEFWSKSHVLNKACGLAMIG